MRSQRPSHRFSAAKSQARRRGLEWSISRETLEILQKSSCFYCGGKVSLVATGLDRVDNTKGYTMQNVVPCCKVCNMVKGYAHTKEETLVMIEARENYRKGRTL
jgi:hypothetical protein